MTQARTPEETIDQLLTLRKKIDYQIRAKLALIDGTPQPKRSRLVIPECGTETAYQRHRHYGQPVDPECRRAHALHNRVQYARKHHGRT